MRAGCQVCGRAPLFYDDRTNGVHLCHGCHESVLSGRIEWPLTAPTTALAAFDDTRSASMAGHYASEHTKVETAVSAIAIDSPDRLQWAADAAKQIKQRLDACTVERDEIAKPLRAIAKAHADRWNAAIRPLERAIAILKNGMMVYQDAQRAAHAAAMVAATSQAEVQAAVAVLAPKPEGVSTRATWSAVVDDESKLPREYWLIDTQRLNREAREQKEAFAVPGARAVKSETVVLR